MGSSKHDSEGPEAMAEDKREATHAGKHDEDSERMPAMQSLLDNHFLLLFIGVAVPAVVYLIWGIMDIVQIPIAR